MEITKAMLSRGYLAHGVGKAFNTTPDGGVWFTRLVVDIARITPGRHGIARKCLDWTEREHHLAGPLGTQFLARACDLGWFRRSPTTRAMEIKPKGWAALNLHLGLERPVVGRKPGAWLSARHCKPAGSAS